MGFSTLVNGQIEDQLAVTDRGLAYGDGLFETCRMIDGVAPLLSFHWQRLSDGCTRLNLPNPFVSSADLAHYLAQAVPNQGLAKLIVTRGSGGRGYLAPEQPHVTWVMQGMPIPDTPSTVYLEGVTLRRCALQLASQPLLAGLKHLNRLEQVLARAEWQSPLFFDGLLFDQDHYLIETTVCNIFIVQADRLLTPCLRSSGVAGVMRAAIIQSAASLGLSVEETFITEAQLQSADAVFLCNSVRGIIPVSAWRLDQGELVQSWPAQHPLLQKISQHWHPRLNLPVFD